MSVTLAVPEIVPTEAVTVADAVIAGAVNKPAGVIVPAVAVHVKAG